jgi:hypothetical protein
MPTTEQELQDRLNIIESMIAEGRRKTESWGWTFVLWGVAYYVAIAWSTWGHSAWAWPVTMVTGVVLTLVIGLRQGAKQPQTTLARAITSIWFALGISMVLVFLALGFSGRLTDQHLFLALICAMLGVANGASAMILRWNVQVACAVVWWAAAVITCFGSATESLTVFLVAIFLCQIVFGIYGMMAKAPGGKARGAVHA